MFTKICMAAAIALGCTLVAPGASFAARNIRRSRREVIPQHPPWASVVAHGASTERLGAAGFCPK
jgi:hypothetical protein